MSDPKGRVRLQALETPLCGDSRYDGNTLWSCVRGAGPAGSASGCSMAFGGATAIVALSAGVLASQCYDYVEVNVRDARGEPICDAEVLAIRGEDDQVELVPCFSAALTAGA